MAKVTRGERNRNPGNIERSAANKWQGRVSDAEYRRTFEFRENGGRFEVFSAVEWGIRALAVLLVNYQDKHGLRTIRGIIDRWAPGHENNTGAYVAHVAKLTGFGPDAVLDLHSYAHMAPLVRAIITHENGRCLYSQAVIDDGLMRAGIKAPDAKVVSDKADKRKTAAAVAGVGGFGLLGGVEVVQQVAPAVTPVLQAIGSLPPWLGIAVVIGAAVGAYFLFFRKRPA